MASLIESRPPCEHSEVVDETRIREEHRQDRRRKHSENRIKRLEVSQRQQAELFEAFEKLNDTIAKFRAESESWKNKVCEQNNIQIQRIEAQTQKLNDGLSSNVKTFVKGDIVWYQRSAINSHSDLEEMLLVTVIGVHHDDFPNVYYTIQPVRPLQFINGKNKDSELSMTIFEEKQTDSTHLLHLDER